MLIPTNLYSCMRDKVKTKRLLFFWPILFLLCLAMMPAVTMAQNQDKEGCQDYYLFNRLNNFYIKDCKIRPFDQYRFYTEKGHVDVEGRYTYIEYSLQKDAPRVSSLQVIRNFTNAVEKAGGEVLYTSKESAYMKLVINGQSVWIRVNTSGNANYRLNIIEEASMKQEIQIQTGLQPAPVAIQSPQPGVQSAQPGVQPAQPGVQSAQPGVQSAQPGIQPNQPNVQPTQTGDIQPQGNAGQVNPADTEQVGGFAYPDFEIVDVINKFTHGGQVPYDTGFYQIQVRNNGRAFSGNLLISGRNDRQPMLAQIYENLSIPAGGDTILELRNFVWPVYNVETVLCSINTELYLDQNNEIEELNEDNNSWSGTVYQRDKPYLHIPDNYLYMGHKHGPHNKIKQGNIGVPRLRKKDAISSSWRRREIILDAWTTVMNCGPTAGNYIFKFWEDYFGDGSNLRAMVGESTMYTINPGETATVEARCTLDMGPYPSDGPLVVTIYVSAVETGSGEEQTFFMNRMEIGPGFWE